MDSINAYITWGLFAVFVLVGAVDIYLALYKGPDHTITEYIRNLSWYHPAVPFLAGFLAGHLFGIAKDVIKDHLIQPPGR